MPSGSIAAITISSVGDISRVEAIAHLDLVIPLFQKYTYDKRSSSQALSSWPSIGSNTFYHHTSPHQIWCALSQTCNSSNCDHYVAPLRHDPG